MGVIILPLRPSVVKAALFFLFRGPPLRRETDKREESVRTPS